MSHTLTHLWVNEGWGQCSICNPIVQLKPSPGRPCSHHPATEDSWGHIMCQVHKMYYHCQLLEVVVLIYRWRKGFFHVTYSGWTEGTYCVILCGQEERAIASGWNMRMLKFQEFITTFISSGFVTRPDQLELFPTPLESQIWGFHFAAHSRRE